MLNIDLRGKRAFIAGIADDGGFGFAIAKVLVAAGASVCAGTWPPAYGIFTTMLERGKMDASLRLADGSKMTFERIYPLDAAFDVAGDVPPSLRESKRYRELGDVSVQGCADRFQAEFGAQSLDIVVHCLANGPEVRKALSETSRSGYLAAVGVSAYSFVSMLQRFGPLMRPDGAFLSLSYLAAQRVIPGYGGGMSSAKAALENDTRVLADEAWRKWKLRVNSISAGPLASRAASAAGEIVRMIDYCRANSPLPEAITADEVAWTAAFLCSPYARGISGSIIFVDKGYNIMGAPLDRPTLAPSYGIGELTKPEGRS